MPHYLLLALLLLLSSLSNSALAQSCCTQPTGETNAAKGIDPRTNYTTLEMYVQTLTGGSNFTNGTIHEVEGTAAGCDSRKRDHSDRTPSTFATFFNGYPSYFSATARELFLATRWHQSLQPQIERQRRILFVVMRHSTPHDSDA
jgi:hypothetical protein